MKNPLFISSHCRIRSGTHKLKLLILKPAIRTEEQVPGVLWIHGGGYQSGSSRAVYVTRALSLVVKFGMVLVAPDYRLSRHHPYPAGLHDCYAALLWLRDHTDELGIRSDQIMIGGESAGGGMTAALCMLARDRKSVNIAFQMPLYHGIIMPGTGTQNGIIKHGSVIFGTRTVPRSYPVMLHLDDALIIMGCRHVIHMSEILNHLRMRHFNISITCGRQV